ncbi:Fumarate reductase flavoprotein subunit [Lachnospiraceae bacterium TWA4]|nr:Fumarate reductase flavoprotein subunit [Lachnospiraceae bacterium TWA4]
MKGNWKEKWLPWTGFIPVLVLVVCVTTALSGYSAPVYELKGTNIEVEAAQKPSSVESRDVTSSQESLQETTQETSTLETAKEGGKYKDGTYKGSAKGFGGMTTVEVVVKNGKISSVKILKHNDDASFINKASSILSKIVAKQSTNVDTVSGATYSSVGIIQATRNALKNAVAEGQTLEETKAIKTKEKSASSQTSKKATVRIGKVKEDGNYKDGTYTGTGTGFGGPLQVKVVIKDSKISSITLVNTKDDASFINKAKSLLKMMVSRQSTNVDTVSGATYSSVGIIQATRNALSKASGKKVKEKETSAKTSAVEETTKKAITPTVKPIKETGEYKDGTYMGTGTGFKGQLQVKVIIKNGKIQSIDLVNSKDDKPFITNASGLLKTIVRGQTTNVDTVSGATFSSKGLIEAARNALSKAKGEGSKEVNQPTTKKETEKEATKTPTTTEESTEEKSVEELTAEKETTLEETSVNEEKETESETSKKPVTKSYKDGDYIVSANCMPDEMNMFEEYKLTLKVTIKNGVISNISNAKMSYEDATNEMFLNMALTDLKKTLVHTTNTNIDAVSGATCSSNAILEAVEKALQKSKEN